MQNSNLEGKTYSGVMFQKFVIQQAAVNTW